jgi:hypothetical protein
MKSSAAPRLPLGLHPSHHKQRNRWAVDYDESLARALPPEAAEYVAQAFRELYDCRFGPKPLITSKAEQRELYRAAYRRRMDALESSAHTWARLRDAPAQPDTRSALDALDPYERLLRA